MGDCDCCMYRHAHGPVRTRNVRKFYNVVTLCFHSFRNGTLFGKWREVEYNLGTEYIQSASRPIITLRCVCVCVLVRLNVRVTD